MNWLEKNSIRATLMGDAIEGTGILKQILDIFSDLLKDVLSCFMSLLDFLLYYYDNLVNSC
jgi:hypothetical protein